MGGLVKGSGLRVGVLVIGFLDLGSVLPQPHSQCPVLPKKNS